MNGRAVRVQAGSLFPVRLVLFSALTALSLSVEASSADSVYVTLRASDREGHAHALTLGVHTNATEGFDWDLGEHPIPPVPAAPAFDVRLLDPMRKKGRYAGMDGYMDIRPFQGVTQADTFYVGFQPANYSYPVVFTWPDSIDHCFDEALFKYRSGDSTVVVDMMRRWSVGIGDKMLLSPLVMIVVRGPHIQRVDGAADRTMHK